MPAVLTVRAGAPDSTVKHAFEVGQGTELTVYSRDDGTVVVDDGEPTEIPGRDRWLPPQGEGRFRFETEGGLTLTNEGWDNAPRVRPSGGRGDAETVGSGESCRILDAGERASVVVDLGGTTEVEAWWLSETDLGQYLEVSADHVEVMLQSEAKSWEDLQLFLQEVITRVEKNRSGSKSEALAELERAKENLGRNRGEGSRGSIRNAQQIQLAMETLATRHGA